MEDYLKDTWLLVCPTYHLKDKPLGLTVLGKCIVIFRSFEKIIALEDRCPHRNVPLSIGRLSNGNIQCAYHGWELSATGHVVSIPGLPPSNTQSSCHIPQYKIASRHGFIWLNLNSNANEEDIFDEFLVNKQIKTDMFLLKTTIQASMLNAIENLLDGFHTPFVHKGWIRNISKTQRVTAHVQQQSDRVVIKYEGEKQQAGFISKWLERGRTKSYGRFILPSVAQLEYCNESGTSILITAFFTPIQREEQQVHIVIETPRKIAPAFIKRWILKPLFLLILKQDKEILSIQQDYINKFGKESFQSTRLDLIRPAMISLLKKEYTDEIKIETFNI